jgi:hypothetical protein
MGDLMEGQSGKLRVSFPRSPHASPVCSGGTSPPMSVLLRQSAGANYGLRYSIAWT